MTTPTRFAQLEQRVNRAVLKHCANVSAEVAGLPVVGIFDDAYTTASVGIGMASTAPTLLIGPADLPADLVGSAVVIFTADGSVRGDYLVAAHEPDGTGMSRLLLEVA